MMERFSVGDHASRRDFDFGERGVRAGGLL